MKKYQLSALMALAITCATGFTACSSNDIGEDEKNVVIDEKGNVGVKSEFVISIPRTVVGTTRMGNNITQNMGSVDQFRGLDSIRLIPFDQEPNNTTAKISDIMDLSHINALNSPGIVNYKVYSDKFVPVGTKHFLLYAKAIDNIPEEPITSMEDKFKYGILHAKGLTEEEFTAPKDILISLEQINSNPKQQADNLTGQRLVNLLDSLANITLDDGTPAPHNKWSTTTNFVMATLYKNFIGMTTSSSHTVAIALSQLAL